MLFLCRESDTFLIRTVRRVLEDSGNIFRYWVSAVKLLIGFRKGRHKRIFRIMDELCL